MSGFINVQNGNSPSASSQGTTQMQQIASELGIQLMTGQKAMIEAIYKQSCQQWAEMRNSSYNATSSGSGIAFNPNVTIGTLNIDPKFTVPKVGLTLELPSDAVTFITGAVALVSGYVLGILSVIHTGCCNKRRDPWITNH